VTAGPDLCLTTFLTVSFLGESHKRNKKSKMDFSDKKQYRSRQDFISCRNVSKYLFEII